MLLTTCETCFGNYSEKDSCEDCNRTGWTQYPDNKMVFVNVYSVTRHYGGPEEGGWYYNYNECIETYPCENKNSEAIQEYLYNKYEENKEGDIYSVLGGTDIYVSIEEAPAESETKERPYYE